jgi:hypothetical protein
MLAKGRCNLTLPSDNDPVWYDFVRRNMLIIAEDKLSREQKGILKQDDYERILDKLISRELSLANMRFLSSDELFDLFVGQLRMF